MWRRTKRFCVLAFALPTIIVGAGCEDWVNATGLPSDSPGGGVPTSKVEALLKVRFSVLPRPVTKAAMPSVDDGADRSSIGTGVE
ncbi:hypothetical protein RAS1_19130 [Phycisphaerae bacterium RAS1]|nr:hypothetical protein RAS1_19130 [Phycisphaerae bacterium RAS1]